MWGLPSRPVAWFIFTNDLSLSSPFKEAARCQVSTKSSHGTPSQPVLPSPRAGAWPPGLPRARRPQPPAPPGFRLLALHLPAPQGPDVAVTLLYLPQRNPRPGRSRRRSPDRRAAGRRGPVPGTQEPRPQTPPRRPGQRWIRLRLRLRDLAQGQTRSRSLAWPRHLIRPDGVHEPLRGCEDGLLRTVARLSAAELGSRPPRQMSTRPELTRFSDRKLGRSCRRVRVEPGAAGWGLGPAPSLREDRSSKPGGLPRDRGPQGRSDPPSCHRAKPGSSEHLGVAPAVCGPARGTAGVARAPGLATSVGCQRDPREDGQSPTGRGTLTPASQMQPRRQASTDPMVVPTRSPARPGRGPGRGRRDPPRRPALQSGPARRSDKFRKTSRVTRLVGWFF